MNAQTGSTGSTPSVAPLAPMEDIGARKKLRLLLIAYVFPPALGSGSFRPLSFANHLQRRSWDVEILTASGYALDNSAMDEKLLERLDARVKVHRARRCRSPRELALSMRERMRRSRRAQAAAGEQPNDTAWRPPANRSTSRAFGAAILELLGYPDNQVGWAFAALIKGWNLCRKGEVDLIFATGSPWSSLVMAVCLGKCTRLPVVLDFRDPWVGNPNAEARSSLVKRLNRRMETFCVRHCRVLIANTEELRRDFLHRYPWLSPTKIHTITNGFDTLLPSRTQRNHKFTITHAGALYLNRSPRQFLLAVQELIASGRIPANQIEVQLIGALDVEDESLAALLQDERINGVVRQMATMPHAQVLDYQLAADVLMLMQPGFPLQVPRKVYEYFSLRKRILAITEPDSATAGIVLRSGMGVVVDNDAAQITAVLIDLYEEWRRGTLSTSPPERVMQFSNAVLAEKLAKVLDSVAVPPPD